MRLLAMLVCLSLAVPADPQAIQRMVATERAFAASALELGVRDSFLTFFADDAIRIVPGATGATTTVARAKDGLEASPLSPLPLGSQLLWEPFTGHVSSDGSLGWLTGGYASLTTATHDLTAHGAYFSVWRRQANGTWRVWLDEGIALPDVWRDASPFRAAAEPDAGQTGEPGEALAAAEARAASNLDGYESALAAGVRLHRDGVMPLVGREAVVGWRRATWASVTFTTVTSLTAASDDLGIALGGYDATAPAGSESGTWARVWTRDLTTRWRIVFETSRKTSR